jgi:lysophospholipase L1-like esterase
MTSLGDSYSSGEGTNVYDEHRQAQKCHRGPLAWPRILQDESDSIAEIDHRACSGAKTSQLLEDYKGNPKQVDATNPDSDVDLVTLTIGGNDAGFAGIISECYRPKSTCADVPTSKKFHKKLRSLVTRLVVETYPAIRAAYPDAEIHHVGYPQIIPPPGTEPVRCGWLGEDEQMAAVEILRDLNFAVQEAAFRAGDVGYVDVTYALSGHELCTRNSWVGPIYGPSWTGFGTEQGHPTEPGQTSIARTVAFALDQ